MSEIGINAQVKRLEELQQKNSMGMIDKVLAIEQALALAYIAKELHKVASKP
jgi:hypothetical protein